MIIGIVGATIYDRNVQGNIDIEDKEFQKKFVENTLNLVLSTDIKEKFDGVYLSFYPIPNKKVYSFSEQILKRIKEQMGDNKMIIINGGTMPENDCEPWCWDLNSFFHVDNYVSQIIIGTYSAGSKTNDQYKEYIKKQMAYISAPQSQYNIMFQVVPKYEKNPKESLKNSLTFIKSSILDISERNFEGFVILSYNTMNKQNWKELNRIWVKNIKNEIVYGYIDEETKYPYIISFLFIIVILFFEYLRKSQPFKIGNIIMNFIFISISLFTLYLLALQTLLKEIDKWHIPIIIEFIIGLTFVLRDIQIPISKTSTDR